MKNLKKTLSSFFIFALMLAQGSAFAQSEPLATASLIFDSADQGSFPEGMFSPWKEEGVKLQMIPLGSCSTSDCFDFDNGDIWLYPATLEISFPNPVPLSKVEVDWIDWCGIGCTTVELKGEDGSVIVSRGNRLISFSETVSLNLGKDTKVSSIEISSFEGQIQGVRFEGGSIEHLHEVLHFQEKVLNTSLSDDPFGVAADGSKVSKFVLNGFSEDWILRVEENANGSDIKKYGRTLIDLEREQTYVYEHPSYIEVANSAHTTINLEVFDQGKGESVASFPLKVWRAPVVMVHGLGGDKRTFKKMESRLQLSGAYEEFLLLREDYSYANKASFARNAGVPLRGIVSQIYELRNQGIAAGKADLIGHSMGGILSRLSHNSSSNEDNINRIITINTPHSGTQLANLGLDTTSYLRNYICDSLGFNCVTPAIIDLAVGSSALSSLNSSTSNYPVPVHSITTNFNINRVTNIFTEYNFTLLPILTLALDVTLDDLYNGDSHDIVVPSSSQSGGLGGISNTVINRQVHIGSASNTQVINEVLFLLKSRPSASVFSTSGFKANDLKYELNASDSSNFIFQKEYDSMLRNNSELEILSPNLGDVLYPGDELTIQVAGSSNVTNIFFFLENDIQGNILGEGKVGNTAEFTFSVDSNFFGKRRMIVLGVDSLNNELVFDTSYVNILPNKAPIELEVNPKRLYMPLGEFNSLEIEAVFTEYKSSISQLTEVEFQFKKGLAAYSEKGYVRANEIGFDTLIVTYDGINSEPIPIEIYEGIPFINPLVLDESVTNVSCNTLGSINIQPSYGQPPYNYQWSSGETDSLLNNLVPGDYSVTISDQVGHRLIRSYTIEDIPNPMLNFTVKNATCNESNGSIIPQVNGGEYPFRFIWNDSIIAPKLEGINSGEYKLEIIDANGCSAVDFVTLSDVPIAEINLVGTNTSCDLDDGEISVNNLGAIALSSVIWNTGDTTKTLGNLSGGDYSVTVVDDNGCEIKQEISITGFETPEIELGNDTLIMPGQTLVIGVDYQDDLVYSWSNGSDSSRIEIGNPGEYSITVTNAGGCSNSDQITVNLATNLTEIDNNNDNVRLFPNPAGGLVMLEIGLDRNQQISFSIIDVLGKIRSVEKVVKGIPGKNIIRFSVGGLPKGNYFVRIQIGEDKFFKQLIKN